MLTKRQQLQQQQLIYGGSNSIHLIRGIRSELLKQPEPPPRRQSKPDTTGLPQAVQKSTSMTHSAQRNSATSPQRNADSKNLSQKNADAKQKPPDSRGDGQKAGSKDVKGRPRRQRPPVYIPPIHYAEKQVPRNVVTIDTSKARGNTDVVRLVARDLGWREVSSLINVFSVSPLFNTLCP